MRFKNNIASNKTVGLHATLIFKVILVCDYGTIGGTSSR